MAGEEEVAMTLRSMMNPVLITALAFSAACGSARAPDAPRAEPAAPTFRLPSTARPLRYGLELTVDAGKPTFSGRVSIEVELDAPTAVVWLHAQDLTITRAEVGGVAATVEPGVGTLIGVRPGAALAAGRTTLVLEYDGALDRERSRGLYAEQEGDDWYAYTFFEPLDARRAVPCFDEPAFKVPWQVTFRVPADQVAVANEPTVSDNVGADGWRTIVTGETPPMPSYLLAFMVGPFEIVDGGVAGRANVPVRFVLPKGRRAELRWAREITAPVVATLEATLGLDYPYRKLDVAVVPRYWGTMEHPGIVAMGQPLTLIRPEDETAGRRRWYMNILAHELAHYWFGDLVTMAWWNDTWLNEALGSWLDLRVSAQVEPAGHWRERAADIMDSAMTADELASTRAIRTPVTDEEGIQASFDNSITYAKGAAVLGMVEDWVGTERFAGFLRAYLERFRWRNAGADDFVGVMREQLGDEAAQIFQSFLEAPGLPLVTARLECDDSGARVRVEQRRSRVADAHLWQFPVCVRHGAGEHGARTCAVVGEQQASIELGSSCPRWWYANADGSGYYRVAIGRDDLERLGTGAFSDAEQVAQLNDVIAGVGRGELLPADAQRLVATFAADDSAYVAASGVYLVGLLRPDWLDEPLYRRYQAYVDRSVGARARSLGWMRPDTDDDETHALRRTLVPLVADGDRALAAEGAQHGRAWLTGKGTLQDDLVGSALSLYVRDGGAAAFDEVLGQARTEPDHRRRGRLLSALAAASDAPLIARALAVALDASFDARDRLSPLYRLLWAREGRAAAWAFARDHLDELLASMRDDEAAGLLGTLASVPCETSQRAEAAELLAPRAARIDGARNAVAQGLESADRCIEQRAREYAGIVGFLEGQQ